MAEQGIEQRNFGRLADGSTVEAITLHGGDGHAATLLTYGATLQSVLVPDRGGHIADVTTGFTALDGYIGDHPYFGSSIGRVANRIARGRFTLDGRAYQLPCNNGPNSLHGGAAGFGKANWTVVRVEERAAPGVVLALTSPDGDQGYPGTLSVTAHWRLDGGTLSVDYHATTDAPTVVNMTNHAYWNLAGDGSGEDAMGHLLWIDADAYLPTDAGAIPTGERREVAGTPFDFRVATAIGARVRDAGDAQILIGRGYDHNMVLRPAGGLRAVARLTHPGSGRSMELASDKPGLQFYSGNFLDGSLVGKSGRAYRMGDAVALEPQAFPDTPNRAAFGSIRLDPGESYRHRIEWRFSGETGS